MAKIKISLVVILSLLSLHCAPDESDIRECLEQTYTSQIGVREATGNNDGVSVESYLKSTRLGKGYAWCAAFVNWTHKQCEIQTVNSPAWSPSWFPKSKVIYKRDNTIKRQPLPGDVFGVWFSSKKRVAHVGFIHDWQNGSSYAITVEGNTNTAGSREGDGVYKKRRLKRQIYVVSSFVK